MCLARLSKRIIPIDGIGGVDCPPFEGGAAISAYLIVLILFTLVRLKGAYILYIYILD